MSNFGKLYCELGQFDRAIEHFESALKISKQTEDRREEGICYNNLGAVYCDQLQLDKAIECQGKSLEIFQSIGDKSGK